MRVQEGANIVANNCCFDLRGAAATRRPLPWTVSITLRNQVGEAQA